MLTPEFPPLLSGHAVLASDDPMVIAIDAARKGEAEAGHLFWRADPDVCAAAMVLEPEVPASRALEMVPLLLSAIGDAIGSIGPANMPFHFRWPAQMRANGAHVGHVAARMAEVASLDTVPAWLVVGFRLDLHLPPEQVERAGDNPDRSALAMEGAGDLTNVELVSAIARHFLSWLDTWEHDGFAPVHRDFIGRIDEISALDQALSSQGLVFSSLDENGNALCKGDAARILLLSDYLPETLFSGD